MAPMELQEVEKLKMCIENVEDEEFKKHLTNMKKHLEENLDKNKFYSRHEIMAEAIGGLGEDYKKFGLKYFEKDLVPYFGLETAIIEQGIPVYRLK
ncbi:MAG: hypothetical protein J7L08_03505 [Candidatus Aenigmarchaeota archaeon]|nr:hypothetical protein [Candidatus Aenigmarchaeota archaeon]